MEKKLLLVVCPEHRKLKKFSDWIKPPKFVRTMLDQKIAEIKLVSSACPDCFKEIKVKRANRWLGLIISLIVIFLFVAVLFSLAARGEDFQQKLPAQSGVISLAIDRESGMVIGFWYFDRFKNPYSWILTGDAYVRNEKHEQSCGRCHILPAKTPL